jgi:hypothetical protein
VGYTDAQAEPLAQRLVADLPGLNLALARVWIKAESGVGNNPLGVTHVVAGKTVLMTYATPTAGVDAAAALVKGSANYAGIRASLSGTARQQAMAIIASPWNAPGSPYYTRVFTAAGLLGSVPQTVPHVQLPATATAVSASTDRIAALQAAIATQTRNVQVNLAAGKTAAAATDQATLTRYREELAGLLAAKPALATTAGYNGPSLATALGSDPTLTTPTQVKQLADQLKAQGVGGPNTTAGDLYAYLIDFIGQRASVVPFNFSGVTGSDPTQNATKTGENTPIPGEVGLAGVSTALGGLGDTAVQVFTYLLAVVVVGLGVFLYSKGGRPQEVPVGP